MVSSYCVLLTWYSRSERRWLWVSYFCASRVSMMFLKAWWSSISTSLIRTRLPLVLSLRTVSSESLAFLKMAYLSRKESVF